MLYAVFTISSFKLVNYIHKLLLYKRLKNISDESPVQKFSLVGSADGLNLEIDVGGCHKRIEMTRPEKG